MCNPARRSLWHCWRSVSHPARQMVRSSRLLCIPTSVSGGTAKISSAAATPASRAKSTKRTVAREVAVVSAGGVDAGSDSAETTGRATSSASAIAIRLVPSRVLIWDVSFCGCESGGWLRWRKRYGRTRRVPRTDFPPHTGARHHPDAKRVRSADQISGLSADFSTLDPISWIGGGGGVASQMDQEIIRDNRVLFICCRQPRLSFSAKKRKIYDSVPLSTSISEQVTNIWQSRTNGIHGSDIRRPDRISAGHMQGDAGGRSGGPAPTGTGLAILHSSVKKTRRPTGGDAGLETGGPSRAALGSHQRFARAALRAAVPV